MNRLPASSPHPPVFDRFALALFASVSRAWRSCHASTKLKFHARKGLVTIEQLAIDRIVLLCAKKREKKATREKNTSFDNTGAIIEEH